MICVEDPAMVMCKRGFVPMRFALQNMQNANKCVNILIKNAGIGVFAMAVKLQEAGAES
jgi:hypothetical protein